MDAGICTIRRVSQGPRRGVHFLDCPSIRRADGLGEFLQLPERTQFYFKTSFDYWNDRLTKPKRFHGFEGSFKKGIYKECFVFKHIEQKCRLYGFLSRPESFDDIELCILVSFCRKKEDATDETMLKRINEIRMREEVIEAVRVFRTELKGL